MLKYCQLHANEYIWLQFYLQGYSLKKMHFKMSFAIFCLGFDVLMGLKSTLMNYDVLVMYIERQNA